MANGHHHPRRRRHGGARDYPPLQPTVVSPRDGGRRLPLLLTASGLTWLAFAPDAERDAVVSMLAARPEAEYQLAREPERLAAILARTRQNGYGENFRGWRQEEKIASIAVPVCSQQRVIGCLNWSISPAQ